MSILSGQMDRPDPAVSYQDPYRLNSNLFVFRKPKRNPRGTAARYYFAGEGTLANLLFLLAVIPYIPQPMLVDWRLRIGCLLLFLFVIVFFLLHRPVVIFLLHRPVIFFCGPSPSRRIQPIYSSWIVCVCVRVPCYPMDSLTPRAYVPLHR